ncbi:Glycosyltransferase-like protein LARGE2 [Durusdinium trenchii]|uniref:Glycosyltransferase-like protein LARGE2 n=1 Tax=Durusdinium trenchii TaxID=1381693 RepID=A0ABP0I119_9DINO
MTLSDVMNGICNDPYQDNTANMTKALTATAFPKWRGEDSKVCGEAATQPSIRLPPLREGRRVKLLHSAISLRMDKDKGTIGSGDGILLLDGGRDGLGPSLLGAVKPSPTETMSKHKTCKFLIWDEGAIRSKKHRNRGSQVNQLERVYLILPEDMQVTYKKRKHYSGTSAGDCLGPIIAPAWDDMDETWNATYALKKVMYGAANRVAVGGKPDGEPAENAKGARRKDTDQEPMAYHAMPSEVVSELYHEYNISHMLDLTCCDGKTAWEAILRRVPFIGVVFTSDHATELMKRLERKCWDGMLNPESPLFEPGLAGLIKKKKVNNKKEKKDKTKKEEEEDEEEEGDAGEEPEEDEDLEQEEDEEEEGESDGGEGEELEEEEDEEEEEPKKGRKRPASDKPEKPKAKPTAKTKAKAKPKGRPKAG